MGLTLWPVALFEEGDLLVSLFLPMGLVYSDAQMTNRIGSMKSANFK